MSILLTEHLDYLSSILVKDLPTRKKINAMLPLRELLSGEVLEGHLLVKAFVQDHWLELSRLLFSLKSEDVDGFQSELLSLMVKYPPVPEGNKDPSLSEFIQEEMLEQA